MTGVQTCALPIWPLGFGRAGGRGREGSVGSEARWSGVHRPPERMGVARGAWVQRAEGEPDPHLAPLDPSPASRNGRPGGRNTVVGAAGARGQAARPPSAHHREQCPAAAVGRAGFSRRRPSAAARGREVGDGVAAARFSVAARVALVRATQAKT